MIEALSIIGLGKLGLPMAAYYCSRGFKVTGLDLNENIVDSVNRRKSPYYEPGLQEHLDITGGNLTATTDYKIAVHNSDISFIIVPTPSEPDGTFSTKYAEAAAASIAEALKSKQDFHVVVLTSTVLPGTTDKIIKPILEQGSGKKCGMGFGLCYNPEFIALGSVIKDLAAPDAILIGESDKKSGDLLEAFYKKACTNNPPVTRMNYYNAELAKITLNVYITTKITLANTFAEICEKMPGGDVDVVTRFLGLDSRIGSKYLKGGLGFGGPCFPRDNLAFIQLAKQYNVQSWLQETTHRVNQHQNERIVDIIRKKNGKLKGINIAFLGITYKPNTDVVEQSAALNTVLHLQKEGALISIYDPAGNENTRKELGEKNITYAGSALECIKGAEFVVLATTWSEFKKLRPRDFATASKKVVLLDCWRFFDETEFKDKVDYMVLGHGELH